MSSLLERAQTGDRRALARLITAVEAGAEVGQEAIAELYSQTGRAHVIGVTGAPGAGKSTLTDALIRLIRGRGKEVAVVAIDPSSPFTGGAILGDRIRMQDHIGDHGVYIRSMGSRGHLGGVAETTPQVVALLDGIGFPVVIIETVGVGQAEVEIVDAADTTVVVLTPGWGDSVQANKAGLLEISNIFAINKADRPGVDGTVNDLKQMLALGAPTDWTPPILPTVAVDGEGVAALLAEIDRHRRHLVDMGLLDEVRAHRIETSFRRSVARAYARRVEETVDYRTAVERVRRRESDPWSAARKFVSG